MHLIQRDKLGIHIAKTNTKTKIKECLSNNNKIILYCIVLLMVEYMLWLLSKSTLILVSLFIHLGHLLIPFDHLFLAGEQIICRICWLYNAIKAYSYKSEIKLWAQVYKKEIIKLGYN